MTVTATTFTVVNDISYGRLCVRATASIIGYDQGYNSGYDQGLTDGNAKGFASGESYGEAFGYDKGYPDGFDQGRFVGAGEAIVGSTDVTPPVVTVTYPTGVNDPLIVSLYDDVLIKDYEVTIGFHNSRRLVAYNDLDGFYVPFDRASTVSGSGTPADPKIITIFIYGGWATNAQLDVKAKVIDKSGNRTVA